MAPILTWSQQPPALQIAHVSWCCLKVSGVRFSWLPGLSKNLFLRGALWRSVQGSRAQPSPVCGPGKGINIYDGQALVCYRCQILFALWSVSVQASGFMSCQGGIL